MVLIALTDMEINSFVVILKITTSITKAIQGQEFNLSSYYRIVNGKAFCSFTITV
jgi:hypothetical protein